MILFEFFAHLFALDFAWIIDLIFANLFFVFAIAALIYIFWEGSHFIQVFANFFVLFWTWEVIGITAGLAIFGATFLLLNYMRAITALKIAEETPALKDKLVIVSSITFYALLIMYKVFFG